jgi:hypothetical protein
VGGDDFFFSVVPVDAVDAVLWCSGKAHG